MNGEELAELALDDTDKIMVPSPTVAKGVEIFNHWTHPPPCEPELLEHNEFVVDASGYIPAKEQIENLMAAGHRLHDWRARMYANEPTPDDVEIDRTLRKDFDFQDAHEEMVSIETSLKKARKEARQKAEADKAAAAESNTSGVTTPEVTPSPPGTEKLEGGH